MVLAQEGGSRHQSLELAGRHLPERLQQAWKDCSKPPSCLHKIFSRSQTAYWYNLQLIISLRKVSCTYIKGWDVAILTGRPLYMEESVTHITVNLGRPRPMPGCATPCCMCGVAFRPILCYADTLAAWQTQPARSEERCCRQLPLGTTDYTTCVSLPLSRSAGSPREMLNRVVFY